jgi:hypothetical protein
VQGLPESHTETEDDEDDEDAEAPASQLLAASTLPASSAFDRRQRHGA